MLVINKKYSNLLNGYNRALELDHKLKTEWESKFKPELLRKIHNYEAKQIMEYKSKMLAWQESERLSIAEWEETEKKKLANWESNEITMQSIYEKNKSQYIQQNQPKIERQKQEKNQWMIAWISSSCLSLCLFFLIFPLRRNNFVIGFLGALNAIGLFGFAIAAFIVFVLKTSSTIKPFPGYIPAPKPQPVRRISLSQPLAPDNSTNLIQEFSCPSVISRWQQEIQYIDQGKEYFRKLANENPEAIGGIPGEMAMLNEHIWCERIRYEGIYILGLKTNKQGDIDGISITRKGLWILESKYLLGYVTHKNGIWKQSVFVRHPGQSYLDGWEEKVFPKPFQPDVQLEKKHEIIKHILSDYSKKNPWITQAIFSTIVFTHDYCDLDISNCCASYSKVENYCNQIFKGQDLDELTFDKQLEIADLLLNANREFEQEEVSALKLAEDIYKQSIESLEKLIKHSGIN